MKADLLVLQVCEFLDNGDGLYRIHEPSRHLSRQPGVVVIDCDLGHHLLPPLLEAADVLVLQGFDVDLFPAVERRRAAGRATVLEANDYYLDIQPWNPRAAMWRDRPTRNVFRRCMARVDAVQTSTPELARRWRPWSRQTVAFPNQLTDLPPLAPPPERPLTVGWGGSGGHLADWYHVAPALQRWLDAHPQVRLAVMADETFHPFLRLPPERYRFHRPGNLADYLRFVAALDVGLAPLLPTDYNRCRSDVKFLEYAAHGVAGVYADLEPYRSSVAHGRTGLLYQTEAELLRHLDALAADPALRRRLREEAYQWVASRRRLADHVGERLAFYRGLLPRPPAGFVVPEEVLAAAVREGSYLQLRPGEPERLLQEASRPPARPEVLRALAQLTEARPGYLAALQQQGKLANDLREPRDALPPLERALALDPTRARTLAEIGRARFALGDAEGAWQYLDRALRHNPSYNLGWQYLLRLLARHPRPDGPRWAERAREQQPGDPGVALAGVRLYPAGERLAVLYRLLEDSAPSLAADERPLAAAAFGEVIQETAGPRLETPEALVLLRRACDLFPRSARLATLLAEALRRGGSLEEARWQHARALALYRLATLHEGEFPREEGEPLEWQLAEHIQRALGRGG